MTALVAVGVLIAMAGKDNEGASGSAKNDEGATGSTESAGIVGTWIGGPTSVHGATSTPADGSYTLTISADGSYTFDISLPGVPTISSSGPWQQFGDRYQWSSDTTGSEGYWFLSGDLLTDTYEGQTIATYTRAASSEPATTTEATTLELCAFSERTGECADNVTFIYGDTVKLVGEVVPGQEGTTVELWRKEPNSDQWKLFGTSTTGTDGEVSWQWRTATNDAVQEAPYHFQVRLPGHETSSAVQVWIIFGE